MLAIACLLAVFWANQAQSDTPSSESGALAGDPITHRAWLDDPDASLGPREALAAAWIPYQGVFARGFTSHVTWLRLRIDPSLAQGATLASDRRLVLSIEPQQLDEVTVYRVAQPGLPLAMVGDTTAPSSDWPRWVLHSVVIPDASEPFELLMRVRNRGSHILSVTVLRWDEARDRDADAHRKAAVFAVFTTVIVVWAAFAWRGHRDRLIGLFVAQQASSLGIVLAQRGLLRFWVAEGIPPGLIDAFSAALIPTYTSLITVFHVLLLRDLGARNPERRLLPWTLAPGILGLLMLIAGFRERGLHIALLTAPLAMPIMLVVASRCAGVIEGLPRQGAGWTRAYLAGAYAVMTALTLPQALSTLGLRATPSANFDWFMGYNLISAVLLGSLLRLRSRQIERQRGDLSLELAEVRRQEQVQSARAAEQSELVSMLVHELKTPLSVISLSLGRSATGPKIRERALRSVKAMQEVIDRCAQIARLEHEHVGEESRPLLQPLEPLAAIHEAIGLQTHGEPIQVDAAGPLPVCTTDHRMLVLVLNNLLDNAYKYGAPEVPVRLSAQAVAREGREGVAFCVSNAVGRSGRPDAQRLFEKYHRGALARHRSGSGLGLYLSQRLATRLGGTLALLPAEQVSFELWLPCSPAGR